MKKEYKSDEAWNEAEINRVLRRNSGWKPIFMTPVIMPLTAEQIAKGWPPLIHFIIIFEREKEGSMKKLKEYWNRMKVNKYVEMLSQGKNPKCNILFYAHGGSKYCVICKADMLEQNHRNYKQKKRMLKPTRIADRPVTFLEMPLVKRPRAKAIY